MPPVPIPNKNPASPSFRRSALRFLLLLVLVLGAPLSLILLLQPAPAVNLVWDMANIAGYLAVALCCLLFYYAGRQRNFPRFTGIFFVNLHRDLGYLALLLATVHVTVLLLKEPLLLEHLKPTAPLYMLAGLAGTVLVLLLVVLSLPRIRQTLWKDYRSFRRVHSWGALLAVFLIGFHILDSYFYLNRRWKAALLLLAGSAVLIHYLINKSRPRNGNGPIERMRVKEKPSRAISYLSVALLLSVSLVLTLIPTLLNDE